MLPPGTLDHMTNPRLVPTGVAARSIGVARSTLVDWWRAGLVIPDAVTAGGHGRWDIEHLRRQLVDLQLRRQRDRDS